MAEADHHVVRFYKKAVYQSYQSDKQGRPVYREADYVEIRAPGQDKQIVNREVKANDKVRWARQWEAYQSGQQQSLAGTPLTEWPQISTTEVARLQSLNIHTVEALAGLTDEGIVRLGIGARELQRKAKYFLEESSKKSAASNMNAKVERLENENQDLHTEVAQLRQQVRELSEQEKPRRGRPPKNAA